MIASLRPAVPADYPALEHLTREAFWNLFAPGCCEHYLVHRLWTASCLIPELNLVATVGTQLVGHIVLTRAQIQRATLPAVPVLCLGPVSVLPAFQNQGLGRQLIRASQELARPFGLRAIFLYGDPLYYARLGFVAAERFGITTADDHYAAALQAYELAPGALIGLAGRFVEDPVYDIEEAQALAFDQTFPPKERQTGLPSQLRFLEVVQQRRPAQ